MTTGKWQVQQREDHGAWHTRWALETEAQAVLYYRGLNTFGKWRKRLVTPEGEVVASQYPTRV